MADGSVVIEVILSDGQVTSGVANLNNQLGGLQGAGQRASLGIKQIVTSLGLVALASKAIDMVKSSLDGAISRYDTIQGFPVVMQQIGFSAEDSKKSIDKLSKGIDGLPTTLDDVASTTQRIAVLTNDLDGAVDTTLALNNAFVLSGSGVADAQRGLQQYVQMLSKGTVDIVSWRTLQETMGVALNDVAKSFGFAGSSAQNDLYAALQDGTITFDQFNKKLVEMDQSTGGFAERAKSSSAGIATSWKNVKTNVVKGVADVIGAIDQSLGGVGSIAKLFDKLKIGIKAVFSFIVQNIPKVINTIRDVRDALEPWLPVITAVVAGIASFATTIWVINAVKNTILALKTAFILLNTTILANPIALVVAAIVAAAVLIFIYWDPIKEFFIKLWNKIKEIGLSIWDSLKESWKNAVKSVKNTWSSITEFFSKLWESVKNTATSLWDGIKDALTNVVNQIKAAWSAIKSFFSSLWNGIVNAVMVILQPFITGILNLFNHMKGGLTQIWEGVKLYFSGVWELIKNIFLGAILLIINLVNGNFEELKNNAIAIWENIKNALAQMWEGIKMVFSGALLAVLGYVTGAWENLKTGTITAFEAIKTFLIDLWNGIKTFFVETAINIVNTAKQSWENIKNATITILNAVKTAIANIWNGIKTFFTETLVNIWNTVKQKFQDILNSIRGKMNEVKGNVEEGWNKAKAFLTGIDLRQIGKNIIDGLINGIKSKINAVKDAMKNVTDGITGKIKSILKIASPSKLFKQYGGWLSEGLAIGIEDDADKAIKSTGNLAKGVSDGFEPKFINNLRKIKAPLGNIIPAAGMLGASSSTSNVYNSDNSSISNNFERMLEGATFVVRSDKDIPALARELGNYIKSQARGKGVVF